MEYYPVDLPEGLFVTYPDKVLHSPSTEPVSYMHFHSHLELGYCYEGCGIFFIDGQVLPFSAGDACIIFPDEIHIAQSEPTNPSQWAFIYLDPLKLLSELPLSDLELIPKILKSNHCNRASFGQNHPSGIALLIRELFTELQEQRTDYTSMVKALMWSLLLKLGRVNDPRDKKTGEEGRKDLLRIAPALKHISENYMHPFRLDKLAGTCRMSPSHFRRIFTCMMKMPPSEYFFMVRIKMAAILLLKSEDSILEISLKVGYSTLSSFNRHFRRILGVSPRVWKNDADS